MKKIAEVKKSLTPDQKAKKLMELQTLYNEIKPQIDELKEDLLSSMLKQDIYTIKTGSYTLSRAKRITPQVIDFDTLKSDLEAHNIEVITEVKFAPQMNIVFKQAIEENKKLKGLEALETDYISIRIKK